MHAPFVKLCIASAALLAIAACGGSEGPRRVQAPREPAVAKDAANTPAGKLPTTAPRNIATH